MATDELDVTVEATQPAGAALPVRPASVRPRAVVVAAAGPAGPIERYRFEGAPVASGAGAAGDVQVAMDTRLGRRVALRLRPDDDPVRARAYDRALAVTARLQHPGIVPVFARGRLPSGQRYVAMRTVPGRTLAALIGERDTLAARLGLLPHLVAATDTVAYAHGQGVGHGDLTAEAIQVGDHGDTVVVGWGAVESASASVPESESVPVPVPVPVPESESESESVPVPESDPESDSESDPDHVRTVPAADARVDVHALGAILFHLLAGQPPPARMASAGAQLIRRAPGVPRPLAAIVERAMAPAPADRYPDARALGDELHRFLDGRLVAAHHYGRGERAARWLRRHARWVVPVVVGVVTLGGVGAVAAGRIADERDQARVAERVETVQRDAAEALVAFVGDELAELLTAVGRMELYQATAGRSLDYYDRVEQVRPLAEPQQVRRADVLLRLAMTMIDAGDLAPSLAQVDRAEALLRPLARAPGASCEVRTELAEVQHTRARVQQQAGDQRAAEDAAVAAAATAAPCVDDPVRGVHARTLIGSTLIRRSWALRSRGELAAAIGLGREAVAALAGLRATGADLERLETMRSVAYLRLGIAYNEALELDGAAAAFAGARAVAEAGLVRVPRHAGWLEMLANVEAKLGYVAFFQGRPADSVAGLRRAIGSFARLRRLDEDNLGWMRLEAIAWNNLAMVYERLDDNDGALEAHRHDFALSTRLIAAAPDRGLWRDDHASTIRNLARVEGLAGHTATATRLFAESVAMSEALAARHPDDEDYRVNLALVRYDACRFQLLTDPGADGLCRSARELLRAMRDSPASLDDLHMVASRWNRRAGRPPVRIVDGLPPVVAYPAGVVWHDSPGCQQACHEDR